MRRHESIVLVFLIVAFYTAHFDALRLCARPKTLQRKHQALHSTVQDSNYYNDKVVECRQNKYLTNGMRLRKLPKSDLVISEIGIGTGTFGGDTSQTEADRILDVSLKECGVNFIDTAELYPIPYRKSDFGLSEQIIGDYLSEHSKSFRESLVISTSICGYSNYIDWARGSERELTRITKKQVFEAVDAQLKRLNVEYIDLLQFQWPERYVPYQNTADYNHVFERREEEVTPVKVQLEIVQELIKQGKVRSFGLSNESPYGVGLFSTTAKLLGLPEPVSLQTPVSLIERHDAGRHFAEACAKTNANLGLIAHSPLAGGVLTGKYNTQTVRRHLMRLFKYPGFTNRYVADPALEAVDAYMNLAKDFDFPPSVLALAWVYSQPYVFSTLIGVSKPSQLLDNIQALNLVPLNEQRITQTIERIHKKNCDPTKGVHDIVDDAPEDDFDYDEDEMRELEPELRAYYEQFLMDSELKMKDKEHKRLQEKYSKKVIR
eukprot:gene9332-10133_t